MKIKNTLSALCLSLAVAGCNLDVKMYDGVMAEDLSSNNIAEVSNGSYRLLKNDGGLIDYGFYFWSLGGDDLSWGGTSTGVMYKIYDYQRNIASSCTEYAWELGYRTIGNANLVIEMIEALGDNHTDEHTVIKGENYYLRALCYFLLVNEFAQPYSNNPTQNPGLPLKLDSDAEPAHLPQSRSTVAEVYEQIVNDLKDAITCMTLPEGMTPKSNCYATKEAAEALLARVYLYMGNYSEAYKMANAVITSGRFSLERGNRYATYPQFVPEENKETIFAVRRTKEKDDNGYSRPGSMFINVDDTGWEEIYASSRYLELLELHLDENGMPLDLRSKFVNKRYVEDGVEDYSIAGYPEKEYTDWTFTYAATNNKYIQLAIAKQSDGRYLIADEDASDYTSEYLQTENYNLGTRYYVVGNDGTKYIGRIEPKVFDAATKRGKMSQFLVYAINKFSYQEQSKQLWSPVISRLSEMYLIRAEANMKNGGTLEATLSDINILRERAGIPLWTVENMQTAGEGGTSKDIYEIIEEERMLELAWEGHRRFDIARNRGTINRNYPGGHLVSNPNCKEIPYNSPSICEFIPQAQYDAYPYKLEQNP